MKTLTVAAALLALLVLPAQAQMGAGKRHGGDDSKQPEQKKTKIDEKAYNEALKRIPEPKEKYDPWSGARPAPDQKSK
jgi:hypothetical protein